MPAALGAASTRLCRPQSGSYVLQVLILRVVLAVEPSERATDVERRRNRGAALRHEAIERHRIRRVEGWWLIVGARRLRDSLAGTADRVRQMLDRSESELNGFPDRDASRNVR